LAKFLKQRKRHKSTQTKEIRVFFEFLEFFDVYAITATFIAV